MELKKALLELLRKASTDLAPDVEQAVRQAHGG